MTQQFAIRRNPDGTVDSICLNCFVTVATCTDQLELIEFEKEHQCRADRGVQRESAGNVVEFPPDRMIDNNRQVPMHTADDRLSNTEKARERIQFRK
jgi:hypothetical protein